VNFLEEVNRFVGLQSYIESESSSSIAGLKYPKQQVFGNGFDYNSVLSSAGMFAFNPSDTGTYTRTNIRVRPRVGFAVTTSNFTFFKGKWYSFHVSPYLFRKFQTGFSTFGTQGSGPYSSPGVRFGNTSPDEAHAAFDYPLFHANPFQVGSDTNGHPAQSGNYLNGLVAMNVDYMTGSGNNPADVSGSTHVFAITNNRDFRNPNADYIGLEPKQILHIGDRMLGAFRTDTAFQLYRTVVRPGRPGFYWLALNPFESDTLGNLTGMVSGRAYIDNNRNFQYDNGDLPVAQKLLGKVEYDNVDSYAQYTSTNDSGQYTWPLVDNFTKLKFLEYI
jgi:hypothetical protein